MEKTSKINLKLVKQQDIDNKLRQESRKFILDHGLLDFLDLCQGAMSELLIKKGIISVNELRDAYLEKIQKATNQCK